MRGYESFVKELACKSAINTGSFKVLATSKQIECHPNRVYLVSFKLGQDISFEISSQFDPEDRGTIKDVVKDNLTYFSKKLNEDYGISSEVTDGQNLVVEPVRLSFRAEQIANLLGLVPIHVERHLNARYSGIEERDKLYDKSVVYDVGKHFKKEEADVKSALKKYYSQLIER